MSRCEYCEGRAEQTCSYDNQPMLDFCTEHFIEHLEGTHPQNIAARRHANKLRKELKKSERGLLAELRAK